ncbi:hypothetical protein [Streptomyces sp. 5-10]|uniref:hypothetical protein n=1 Tax=Streptomyces sp. 5-10 TaxID=878925 RepID=UPI00168B4267|nr:hypothetical protein [Streptomyces sp. 5-10]MBD3004873.1 hypothetical protein [Streptomyces sp. 5-10]
MEFSVQAEHDIAPAAAYLSQEPYRLKSMIHQTLIRNEADPEATHEIYNRWVVHIFGLNVHYDTIRHGGLMVVQVEIPLFRRQALKLAGLAA